MRTIRKILFPFSWLYDLITSLRNYFFEVGVLKSKSYKTPTIVVGNLSVGGTGKSPMIEYLIRLLKDNYRVATLSRGYGRKTKGFLYASRTSKAEDIGDEPLQFYHKYHNEITVAVDANRQNGISKLKKDIKPEVILLDDAYQHRKVKAGMYVLLTKYDDLYINDMLLPAGNLRESKRGAKRARLIVVTKCPENLSLEKQNVIRKQLKTTEDQQICFATISYDKYVYNAVEKKQLKDFNSVITLVTGIANPKPLLSYLDNENVVYEHLSYKDHYNFTDKDISALSKKDLIITTEKDYMRLKGRLSNLYYLPIETSFLSGEIEFQKTIFNYTKKALSELRA